MKVRTNEKKVGGKAVEEAVEGKFFQISPLFSKFKTDSKMTPENMSPIWGVSKTTSSKKVNMRLDVALFEVPPLRCLNDVKFPSAVKSPLFNVQVQVATNTRKIEKNEILCFSTMLDGESEKEDEGESEKDTQ